MSMIEDIWEKDYVAGGDTAEKDEEISRAMEMFTKYEGILEKNLTGENLEAFRETIKWQEEILSLYEYLAFRDGFKIGVKIGLECSEEVVDL